MKNTRWKNVLILLIVGSIGLVIGIIGTLNIVNITLAESGINIKMNLSNIKFY